MSIVLLGSTSGSCTLQEQAIAGTTTLTLPTTSGTVLTSASSINASSITTGTLPAARLPAGSILQVVQTVKTDTFSGSGTNWYDITGYSCTITPTSASSKILLLAKLSATSATGSYYGCFTRLLRNSTVVFVGDASGSRTPMTAYTGVLNDSSGANHILTQTINYIDSPNTTSAVTYKFQLIDTDTGSAIFVNRSPDDFDTSAYGRTASSIILMEISG